MSRFLAAFLVAATLGAQTPWERHTIDDRSSGADGARLHDVNNDGFPDVATGWEEGGRVRAYLNPGPGPGQSKTPWPAVTVGEVASPEDAVFVDLDQDGAVDVVSSTEGANQTLYFHWAPKKSGNYLRPSVWHTQALPASRGLTRWMFALPAQIDGRNGPDLFAGSKDPGGVIGWWQAPADPRRVAAWRWRPLYKAGWIMSLQSHDMDSDGDPDLLATDRKGVRSGILWLENPGPAQSDGRWREHRIGPVGQEQVMFLTVGDLDQDGRSDIATIVSRGPVIVYLRRPVGWDRQEIRLPFSAGTGKAVAILDVNLDGAPDLAFTCENALDGKDGAMWLEGPSWTPHVLSGPTGIKFDRMEWLDLDQDGDLDMMTCEERDDLGVIWYENPTH